MSAMQIASTTTAATTTTTTLNQETEAANAYQLCGVGRGEGRVGAEAGHGSLGVAPAARAQGRGRVGG